jgi:hypothetical protein
MRFSETYAEVALLLQEINSVFFPEVRTLGRQIGDFQVIRDALILKSSSDGSLGVAEMSAGRVD